MTTQSERTLERNLIKQLRGMGYEYVRIPDEAALVANLKTQLEKHNHERLDGKPLSEAEFGRVLNHLDKGNVYDRAKILRDTMHLVRDDGTSAYLEFLNQRQWCHNEFQVTNQITNDGTYLNRYDVTILLNGLPLVQIELKRRGLELKEAFNQVNRYRKHSYAASHGLFQYIQLFVISNGVNTKYYANTVAYHSDKKASFKQTFSWADKENRNITTLDEFAAAFLDRCHAAKMIARYMVLTEVDKTLLILRPYQYYAVEAIVDRVKNNSNKNGYVWHTTGSGKTLTSFKAAQILVELPDVDKVVFVVDRNDLDYQTIKEFNKFKEGSVDATDNTRRLVEQFGDATKLIVTTIQKLNTAITREHHLEKMAALRSKKVVFIFDECHRSQFGLTHQRIIQFFNQRQLFGFTGTPIFAENLSRNELGQRTTKDLFGDCLHQYVITDAIRDENVLRFSVEYVGRYRERAGSRNNIDIDVEGIDVRELMESPARIEKIVDYILANHDRKTHSREFTAMMCVSSVDVLTKYYELLAAKKAAGQHNLKVATIFSYTANEEDRSADGLIGVDDVSPEAGAPINQHSRDKLERYIGDYNRLFGTSFTTRDSTSFYNYYKDIAARVKRQEIDLLLVVNMFLTGFDSKTLNTLYVDKNLRYHGLIQAYSRTNRILNELKSQGNIVVFRNLKKATDDAIALFANKDANEIIFLEPYEEYLRRFNAALASLQALVPSPGSVDGLTSEDAQFEFVTKFRELLRLKNVLVSFADFEFAHTNMTAQEFVDYKSKYLDIYDKVRVEHEKERVSILEDVDFELELLRRDTINVDYIVRLLARMVGAKAEQKEKLAKQIGDIMAAEPELRSKRDLIAKFIEQNIPQITESDQVEGAFEEFWAEERTRAFEAMCQEEGLDTGRLQALIDEYVFTGRQPRRHELANVLKAQPKILERDSILSRLGKKLQQFIEVFVEGF